MSDRKDAFCTKVEADRRKRAKLYFNYPGPWEFFFSEAGRAITKSNPSAIAVYMHIIAKQPLPPKKRERNRLGKIGLWPPKEPNKFSFPVEEGPIHGIGKKATARGIRILHEVGAINRIHSGSATRGDFALYEFSERWRQWKPPDGGPNFTAMEWKKALVIAVRDPITKRFVPTRTGKKKAVESFVVAPKDTNRPPLMAPKETRGKTLVAPKAMNKTLNDESLVAPKAILSVLTNTSLKKESKSPKGQEVGQDYGRGGDVISPKRWQPPRSELRENVKEILRQRPDPRASNSSFVRSLVNKLELVCPGSRDRRRVELQERDLDDWTINMMLAVAGDVEVARRGGRT